MVRLLRAIFEFFLIIILDALISFIVFGTTTYFFAGSSWGTLAFILGLFLCYPAAREAVQEQRVTATVKRTTGVDVIEGQLIRGGSKQVAVLHPQRKQRHR